MKISQQVVATPEEELCLEQFASLNSAIQDALLAISEDSLEQLEDTLWKQQVLCANLQRSILALNKSGLTSEASNRIAHATAGLRILNNTYTSLVQQAQASAEVLQQLCSPHTQAKQTSGASSSLLLSWEA